MTIESVSLPCTSDELAVAPALAQHVRLVADQIVSGGVVPFLGAGVSLSERTGPFQLGQSLPNGEELARFLAAKVGYEQPCHIDLLRSAQYMSLKLGPFGLYKNLRSVFNINVDYTATHAFLARLPAELRRKSAEPATQLIVTTNYDDLLERAFVDAEEPFDVIRYVAEGPDQGKFVHRDSQGNETLIREPNKYSELDSDRRTVIMKIHGAISRNNATDDSYVITEDHYIDYLSFADISNLIPASVMAKLRYSYLLFLGYSLSDWNLRVILRRIWREQQLRLRSWAVQRNPSDFERQLWGQRDVEIFDTPLETYIRALTCAIGQLPSAPGGQS